MSEGAVVGGAMTSLNHLLRESAGCLFAALVVGFVTAPANAEGMSGEVMLVSDYRFRGASASNGDPSVQAGLEWASEEGWYAGVWASTLGADNAAGDLEIDLYAGRTIDLTTNVSFDANVIYYAYPSPDTGSVEEWSNFELNTAMHVMLSDDTQASAGLSYAWAQESLGDEESFYVFIDTKHYYSDRWKAVAHIGYTDGSYALSEGGSDVDWAVGLAYELFSTLWVGVDYIGLDVPQPGGYEPGALVFSLSKTW